MPHPSPRAAGSHRAPVTITALAAVTAATLMLSACAAEPAGIAAVHSPISRLSETLQQQDHAPEPEAVVHTPEEIEVATGQLFQAVQAADEAAVREAIAAGADLERRGPEGRTPLVLATKANLPAIAIALLEAGANPNTPDDMLDSAYLYAGAEGYDEILLATLAHGADLTSTNRYGGTALIPASEHGHISTVRILIDAGVPLDHINNLGWTALHEAILLGGGSQNNVEVVRMLLAAGANPTLADGNGTPPRDLAANLGYFVMVADIDAAIARG